MDALISTLPNTQGDPLLIFGVSVQLSVVWFCLLRNVADLVPGHSPFSFQLRASARLHLSFSSLNCTLALTKGSLFDSYSSL